MIVVAKNKIMGSCKAKDFKKEIEALKELMEAEK